jgi:hypothetical protein
MVIYIKNLAVIFICVFWITVCYLGHYLLLFLGQKVGIWKLESKIHPVSFRDSVYNDDEESLIKTSEYSEETN